LLSNHEHVLGIRPSELALCSSDRRVAVAIGLSGFYATRKWVQRVHGDEHSHNDIVGFFLGAVGLFYGITLGLVAVGTWQTY